MNENGHLSSSDVSSTGQANSSFFENKVTNERTTLDSVAFGNVTITEGIVSLAGSFDIESVQLNSVGEFTMTLAYAMETPYIVVATVSTGFSDNPPLPRIVQVKEQTATTFRLLFSNTSLLPTTPVGFSFVVFRVEETI